MINKIFVLFIYAVFCFSQNNTDSILMKKTQETVNSDSCKAIDYLIEIQDSISVLNTIVLDIQDSDSQFTSIILGIMTGVIASILTLFGHNFIIELRLRKMFKYLEGKYEHLVGNEIKKNVLTNIKYIRGGKLYLDTKTNYGNWNCRIRMDKDISNMGGGAFNYENKDEGGFMNIFVKDKNSIYVFPFTLTHTIQKVNFYILKKI